VVEEGKSGKRVVLIMLAMAVGVALVGWFAASRVERDTMARREAAGEVANATVLSEGVLYEASAGDPGLVTAKDVGSGKELWRVELGSVKTPPTVKVVGELVEVEIAGTPWMTLERASGEPVE
jgi:hypothetical protein